MDTSFSAAERRMLMQACRQSGTPNSWLPWLLFGVGVICVAMMVTPDVFGGVGAVELHGPSLRQRIAFGGLVLTYLGLQTYHGLFRRRALLLIRRLALAAGVVEAPDRNEKGPASVG